MLFTLTGLPCLSKEMLSVLALLRAKAKNPSLNVLHTRQLGSVDLPCRRTCLYFHRRVRQGHVQDAHAEGGACESNQSGAVPCELPHLRQRYLPVRRRHPLQVAEVYNAGPPALAAKLSSSPE